MWPARFTSSAPTGRKTRKPTISSERQTAVLCICCLSSLLVLVSAGVLRVLLLQACSERVQHSQEAGPSREWLVCHLPLLPPSSLLPPSLLPPPSSLLPPPSSLLLPPSSLLPPPSSLLPPPWEGREVCSIECDTCSLSHRTL